LTGTLTPAPAIPGPVLQQGGESFDGEKEIREWPAKAEEAVRTKKDVKIDGTNSVKSFRINKSSKKRTQNELVFDANKLRTNSKNGRRNRLLYGIEARICGSRSTAGTAGTSGDPRR
jgi:hypothetical protein